MKLTKPVAVCVVLLSFLFLTISAFAQTYRAQIRGLVTDNTGAVLPGATVTLSNVNTGVNVTRQSDSDGLYIFDYVNPGTYRITVTQPGFGDFTQENIAVQSGGDVTVNANMKPGTLRQSVTVEAAPPAVEFNSSNQELTIDTKMANDTPRLDRNPFKLTLLEPAAINTRGEMQPFNSWAANSVDLGGGTNLKNNLLVDGSPIGIGFKNAYPPNQDAVQETIVAQNSVEAESGHSAGGIISVTTKGGTNEWHGSLFYLGRYPWLSAEADRTTFSQNAQRQNMFGGTLGNPLWKNKIFNFSSVEYWKIASPATYQVTVPTPLERSGDFSQTLAADGTVRPIYDPFSTVVDPVTGTVTRAAFPNNRIPANRIDPLSAKLASYLWDPNQGNTGYNHPNNFKKGYLDSYNYYNWSDRIDYVISDKWRVSGLYGRYYTTDLTNNPTPNNSPLYVPSGSERGANQVIGDAIWSVSPSTAINFHGDWYNLIDAFASNALKNGWDGIWPNGNTFYKAYQDVSTGVPIYYPNINIGGSSFGGTGYVWNQRPSAEAFSVRASQQRGSHYLTAGFEYRRSGGPTLVSGTSFFSFNQALTANTFNSPDLTKSGDAYATFLLGALDSSSQMVGGPAPNPLTDFFGMYIGDDWKVTRNLTVILGLRDEYETAWHDPAHNLSQGLDLSTVDPAIAANPPQMPAQALAIVGPNYFSYNGLWRFTSSSNPGMWQTQKLNLQPRFGLAYRLNDKTAIRFGYAMYTVPTEYNFAATPPGVSGYEALNFLEPPYLGLTSIQPTAPLLKGVPQATLSNPYPATNPLIPPPGKAVGTNLGRGGTDLIWYPQFFQKAYNHRLNLTVEHQFPGQFVATVTYFRNFGDQHFTKSLNNIDPRIQEQYQGLLNNTVPNPFYHYLNTTLVPGPLYNQPTVSLGTLLRPYPLYGGLYQLNTLGAGERYQDLEVRIQKRFSQGYNFLLGYIYIREKYQQYFNDLSTYLDQLSWQASDQPHHRITSAGSYELPFGKGKRFLAGLPRAADALIGGWQITGVLTFNTGDYPRFGNLIVVSNPCQNVPTGYYWNPSAFQPLPAGQTYTLRTNPLQYSCITGPSFFDLDASLLKNFRITEKWQAQLKMTAYNATNKLNLGDPNTSQTSPYFGQALFQGAPAGQFGAQTATYGNQAGRQIELGVRLLF
jgi:hypothetical protein